MKFLSHFSELCYAFLTLLFLVSCSPNESRWIINKTDLHINEYKKCTKFKNQLLGSKFIIQNNGSVIHFINESNKLLSAQIFEEKIDSFLLPINKEIIGTYFGQDTTGILTQDSFYLINNFGELINKYKSPLISDNFIISSLYEPKINKFGDLFYLQLGLKSNKLNYTDENIFLFFNSDTIFKLLQYPAEYNTVYQHYSEVASAFNNNYAYYIPATTNKLYRANLKNNKIETILLDGKYIEFDTTKYTDILYVKKYTESTFYNFKIISTSKYIYLIRRTNIKDGKYKLEVLAFNNKLELIDRLIFNDKIDITNVGQFNDNIFFLNIINSKLIKCSLIY